MLAIRHRIRHDLNQNAAGNVMVSFCFGMHVAAVYLGMRAATKVALTLRSLNINRTHEKLMSHQYYSAMNGIGTHPRWNPLILLTQEIDITRIALGRFINMYVGWCDAKCFQFGPFSPQPIFSSTPAAHSWKRLGSIPPAFCHYDAKKNRLGKSRCTTNRALRPYRVCLQQMCWCTQLYWQPFLLDDFDVESDPKWHFIAIRQA